MDGRPWRAVYVMSRTAPTYWVQALAHELMHVAGYVRGTLPLPGVCLPGFASTDAEEAVADAGAMALCNMFGVAADESFMRAWPAPDGAELAARLALVTGSR